MSRTPFQIGERRPATPSATVLLIRDGLAGVEVFMLQRHLESDFVGGAFVFPGGKVDQADSSMPADTLTGSTGDDTAFRVAAIRETFEESGILLAQRSGRTLDADDLATAEIVEARRRLSSRTVAWDWRPWLLESHIALELDSLAWWSWWVTPERVHRRFDTRFFVAKTPNDQQAGHDDIETTASRWMAPSDALAAAEAGAISIILPTRKNLEHLSQYPTTGAAFAAARDGAFPRPRIQPEVVQDEHGEIRVAHPSFPNPEKP